MSASELFAWAEIVLRSQKSSVLTAVGSMLRNKFCSFRSLSSRKKRLYQILIHMLCNLQFVQYILEFNFLHLLFIYLFI